MEKKIRTLFIATSEFALPSFQKLLKLKYIKLTGVVTQPDKPVGRAQVVKGPPVKQYYMKLKKEKNVEFKIYQPENISKNPKKILEETKPELIIVACYGQFIPKKMLQYPKFKALNIHGSLLPNLRGAVPIPMAILEGNKYTGVTIQIMEEKMDMGKILAKDKFLISHDETTKSLTKKLSIKAADLIEKVLPDWIDGKIKPKEQVNSKATYCYMNDISKKNAIINWSKPADEIEREIRAFYPWPVAWFKLSKENNVDSKFLGKRLKIYKAKKERQIDKNFKPGELFKHKKELYIQTGKNILRLERIQIEGKKKMSGKKYLFLLRK